MEERLRPVNVIVGLATPNDINSAVLFEAGFRLTAFEVPVLTLAGERVTVDVALFNGATSHFLLCEAKSGANLDERQARRYTQIDPLNVVQAAHATLTHTGAVTAEVLYVCLEEYEPRIDSALEDAEVKVPVLYVGTSAVRLAHEDRASAALRSAFNTGSVKLNGPPPRLIPFDHDSPVEIIKPYVKAELVAELSHNRPCITTPVLTERVAPYAALLGRRARAALTTKVNEACRPIASDDPATFCYQPPLPNEPASIQMLRTPETNDPRGRTQAYQALARRPGGRRRPPLSPDLFDLLTALEVEDDAGNTDDSQEGEE